ncbi:MAG: hypothetical protein ACTSRS_09740 [Candidatus Helarchaeota archaeon]
MSELVLPFIGGEHPFSPQDFEAIEMAAVLMDAESEKKKKETFLGIYKTYLPLWVVSIDGRNGVMVEGLILTSDKFRMRRFDKVINLNPHELSAESLDDFINKLRHYESQINAYQKEIKIELDGYLNPTIAAEIRELFTYITRQTVHQFMIMSKRLSQESAELMFAPIISAYHVNVQKILHDFYQIPLIVNSQLGRLFDEFQKVTRNYVNKVNELSQKAGLVKEDDSFKVQNRMTNNLVNELLSFRDTKDRNIKKLQGLWNEIQQLNGKIQQGYVNLLSSIFKTKSQILELGAPFQDTTRRGAATSILLPIYLSIFREKRNRITYFPPLILNFTKKKELTRPKGLTMLKDQLENQYSKALPPGISEIEDQNFLLKPDTQQLFNDGVHKLRETKIIDSKTYVRVMDAFNEFFQKAGAPPKTRL